MNLAGAAVNIVSQTGQSLSDPRRVVKRQGVGTRQREREIRLCSGAVTLVEAVAAERPMIAITLCTYPPVLQDGEMDDDLEENERAPRMDDAPSPNK